MFMKKHFIKLVSIAIVMFVTLLSYGYTRLTEDSYVVTVTDKFVKNEKYLVYTTEGTFEVTDTLMYFRWTSSDTWGEIEKGATYKITATGFRLGQLSMYENIISLEKIEQKQVDSE